MRTPRFAILVLSGAVAALGCGAAVVAWGQPPASRPAPGTLEQLRVLPEFKTLPKLDALHATAVKGVDQYRMMVNPNNFRSLGLDQPSQAATAQLGTPTKDYMVRLDKLRDYKAGDDPRTLLSDTGMVHYPVVAAGKTRSTVTVVMQQGEWKLASVGDASRSEKRSLAVQESARRLNAPQETHFTVRVPALNLEFEGVFDASNQLQLTPIVDSPDLALKAGVPEPASAVFARLVPAAKAHDNLPH